MAPSSAHEQTSLILQPITLARKCLSSAFGPVAEASASLLGLTSSELSLLGFGRMDCLGYLEELSRVSSLRLLDFVDLMLNLSCSLLERMGC